MLMEIGSARVEEGMLDVTSCGSEKVFGSGAVIVEVVVEVKSRMAIREVAFSLVKQQLAEESRRLEDRNAKDKEDSG
jgi:hypothetical protein